MCLCIETPGVINYIASINVNLPKLVKQVLQFTMAVVVNIVSRHDLTIEVLHRNKTKVQLLL